MKHSIMRTPTRILWTAAVVISVAALGVGTCTRGGLAAAPADEWTDRVALLGVMTAFAEDLGATVSWDQSTQSSTATLGDKAITFTLGSVQALANGEQVGIDVAPYLNAEGDMMVQLQPLAEALGATVVSKPEGGISYVIQRSPGAQEGGDGTTAQLPLEVALELSHSLFDTGASMAVPHVLPSGEEHAVGRRVFIAPMLEALKVLIDNGVPDADQRPELPSVSGLAMPMVIVREEQDGRVEVIQTNHALLKKHWEEMEARRNADLLLDAWGWRRHVAYGIRAAYSQVPYATDELRQLATEILKDDAVVSALVERVETNIARKAAGQTSIDRP